LIDTADTEDFNDVLSTFTEYPINLTC
jgi:hypothetical protein